MKRRKLDDYDEKGWAVMSCRPVLMSSLLEPAGFMDIQRFYRPNRVLFVPLPFGTEIVLARKPETNP